MAVLESIDSGGHVTVSEAEIAPLIASGKFRHPADEAVLVAPSGDFRVLNTRGDDFLTALTSGYRPASDIEISNELQRQRQVKDELEFGSRNLEAAALGAARGASFGLSDILASQFYDEGELAGIKRANPYASGIGEVGGVLTSFLINPAAGAAKVGTNALVGAKTATGALGAARNAASVATSLPRLAATGSDLLVKKTGEKLTNLLVRTAAVGNVPKYFSSMAGAGARSAVEGALYATGNLISEHALGEPEINGERVLQTIGLSALMSGALGGSLQGLLAGSGAAKDALVRKIASNLAKDPQNKTGPIGDLLRDQARSWSLRSLAFDATGRKKLDALGIADDAADALRKIKMPDGDPILKAGANAFEISSRLNEVTSSTGREIGDIWKRLTDTGVTMGMTRPEFVRKVGKPILADMRKRAAPTGEMQAELKRILQSGDPSSVITPDDVFGWLQTVGNVLDTNASKEVRKSFGKLYDNMKTLTRERFKPQMSPGEYAQWIDKDDIYRKLVEMNRQANRRLKTLESNRMYSLTDYIIGGTFGGAPALFDERQDDPLGVLGKSALASFVSRTVRTRGPSAGAAFFDHAAKMVSLEKAIKAAQAKESAVIAGAVNNIMKPSAKGATKNVPVSGMLPKRIRVLSDGPDGQVREFYMDVADGGGAHTFRVQPNGDIEINADTQKFLSSQITALKKLDQDSGFANSIRDSIERDLGNAAPETARSLSSRILSTVSFLASKAPQVLLDNEMYLSPASDAQQKKLSKQDAIVFSRYLVAAEDPYFVLDQAGSGSINPQGIEAVKKLYPQVYSQFLAQLVRKLKEEKKPIPYNKRIILAQMFDIPMADATMSPDFIQLMQQTATRQQQNQQQVSSQPSSSGSMRMAGLDSIASAVTGLTTNNQRIEAGIK